jgi:hypothetical protein
MRDHQQIAGFAIRRHRRDQSIGVEFRGEGSAFFDVAHENLPTNVDSPSSLPGLTWQSI